MPRDDERARAPVWTHRRPPPLIWLAAAIFVASIAGCIVMIVLAERHADVEVATGGAAIFKVPLERAPAMRPAESAPPAAR